MGRVAGKWQGHLQKRAHSDLLYIVWLCWGAALLLYVLGSDAYLWPVAPIPLALFILLLGRIGMFGRKGSSPTTATVVAAGARFKGDLHIEGDLEVRGQLVGTIVLDGGVLRIMEGGLVEGEVSAPHVIINGLLDGSCVSAEVEILENGRMQGIFKGGRLSICKGGNFIGHSHPGEEEVSTPVAPATKRDHGRASTDSKNKEKDSVEPLP